jgi:DNA-directed RNA polymerase subunit RPC12/RpoP
MSLDVYRCEACGSEFNDSVTLVSHRTVHAGQTVTTTTVQATPAVVYKCETCGAAFNNSDALMMHKTAHARPVEKVIIKTTTVQKA